MQDIDFDLREKLHSIPARFGIHASLTLTRLFHLASICLFCWAGLRLNLGLFYFAGLFIAGALLAYENSLVKPNDLSKLNMAFFTMNGIISVLVFFFAAAEVVFGRGKIV
jgi:4-hydroxybenzoate polyprenyltransferase